MCRLDLDRHSAFTLCKLVDLQYLCRSLLTLTTFNLMDDVGREMILENQVLDTRKRLFDRVRLCDDVNAVLLLLYHALKSLHLPRNNTKSSQCRFFHVRFHAAMIPPGGILSRTWACDIIPGARNQFGASTNAAQRLEWVKSGSFQRS